MSATRPSLAPDGARPPQPRAAAVDVGRAFKGCVAAVRRMRGRETRLHDELSDAQYGLLFGLCERQPLPTSELAVLADLSPATATGMLDGLVAAGLVERVRSERDRRVVLTSLTEHGLELVNQRRARFEPRWNAALAEFSDDELRTAAAVLDRLRDLFNEVRPDGESSGEAPPS